MFTNNYIKWQRMAFVGDYSVGLIDVNGASVSATTNYSYQTTYGVALGKKMASPTLYSTGAGLIFGTGATPATKDDYCLESQITAGLSIKAGSTVIAEETPGVYVAQVTHTLTNTSDAPINLYEFGLVGEVFTSGGSSKYVLFERTVLSEPITIHPGGLKLVTYKITFNQTLNVE